MERITKERHNINDVTQKYAVLFIGPNFSTQTVAVQTIGLYLCYNISKERETNPKETISRNERKKTLCLSFIP